jgi:hypothetical protein
MRYADGGDLTEQGRTRSEAVWLRAAEWFAQDMREDSRCEGSRQAWSQRLSWRALAPAARRTVLHAAVRVAFAGSAFNSRTCTFDSRVAPSATRLPHVLAATGQIPDSGGGLAALALRRRSLRLQDWQGIPDRAGRGCPGPCRFGFSARDLRARMPWLRCVGDRREVKPPRHHAH